MRKYIIGIAVGVLLTSAVVVLAGSLDSTDTPANTLSYNLEEIYDRLDTGATDAQTTFTEPAAGPGSTMHTLNEIYDLIGERAFVPKTGQTISYTVGDDGDLEKGVAWPVPRFITGTTGVVTDTLTGLIWLKNANCFGARTWTQALSVANGLADPNCGLSDGSSAGDWRLPNTFELQSLFHLGVHSPVVPNTAGTGKWAEGDPFTDVQTYYYWSSTTCARDTSIAWYVYMHYGSVYSYSKAGYGYVWPVRGGQ
jgi:hypothetical protein